MEAAQAGQKMGCPYGKPIFEVTWPNMTQAAILDAQLGVHTSTSFFMHVSIIYGYIPYIIAAITILEFLVRRGTRELSSVLFLGFVTIFNELIFKNLVKQPRPERSCLTSCGMPSGHSTMSSALLTMCLLDTALRVSYRPDQDVLARAVRRGGISMWRFACRFLLHEFVHKFTLLPLTSWDELSQVEGVLYSSVWFLLLFPIPIARTVTYDHTTEQVMWGSLIGFLEACCWCYFVRTMQHKYNHMLGYNWKRKAFTLLTHNYALPRFVAEARVQSIPCQSLNPERELWYYEELTTRRREAMGKLESDNSATHAMGELKSEERYLQHREACLHRIRSTMTHHHQFHVETASFGSMELCESAFFTDPPKTEGQ